MVGFDAKNKNILDPKFICPVCSLILREPVQLNSCGHRLCQSCLPSLNQTSIECAHCRTTTSTNQIILDRGLQNEMHSLPIICSYCNWSDTLKNYQEHLNQSHSNPKCEYCDEQFHSVNQLNQHIISQCQKITVDCLLKNHGCHQQIIRCELSNHYLSKQHHDSILNVVQQMRSQLGDAPETMATTDNNAAVYQLEDLYDSINILGSGTKALNEDTQRLDREIFEHEAKLQNLMANASQVKVAVEEETTLLERTTEDFDILNQDVLSVQEKINDMQYISCDGTFTWKITKFQEKMRNAQSERQISIYSPPFYSSPAGYKMRARLYLNGDGNARQTHMSLFFVLMRGRNDPILKFPFSYKVTFCLYSQVSDKRHYIDSFRPDIRSNSFQRPRSDMNIASGIPKFFPLTMIHQEGNPYVRDDTMFIKVMVDFEGMPKTLLPFALSLNPGIPTSIQHQMVKAEAERRAQGQTS